MTLSAVIKRLQLWLRAMIRWLGAAWLAWLALAALLIAGLCVALAGAHEPSVRIVGLALQVLGIGTVALGIRKTRKLFGRPSLLSVIRLWLKRFPRYGGQVISASGDVTGGATSVRARAYQTANPVDGSVEARLDALETSVRHIHERISGVATELDQQARDHGDAIERERHARAAEQQRLWDRLEATETGGLSLSAVGVLWLGVGVIMSTAAPEIARWLH